MTFQTQVGVVPKPTRTGKVYDVDGNEIASQKIALCKRYSMQAAADHKVANALFSDRAYRFVAEQTSGRGRVVLHYVNGQSQFAYENQSYKKEA